VRWIRDLSCGDPRVYLAVEIRRVFGQSCGKVKQEKLGWLADNPLYTNRFAWYVGRRCRAAPSQAVARELRLDWHTVKEVEKQYRREQLRRAGMPGPRGIGSEESSIKKGHRYRLVVSDLERRRVRWCGGKERSEASMELFYQELGTKKSSKIRLAVMDLGKPFRTSTLKPQHAPHTAIRFDKFHGLRHLGEARDKVRQAEYRRLTGQDRQFSKGQKYTLLSRREHVTLEGRQALKTLLAANNRLQTADLLKESVGQLWSDQKEGWARRFFDNWRAALKWQRLQPYEQFAELLERHGEGIAAFCHPENKVPLGFVEGLNNKIRIIQRRAYGLRDEEYLRLKILTCMLPEL